MSIVMIWWAAVQSSLYCENSSTAVPTTRARNAGFRHIEKNALQEVSCLSPRLFLLSITFNSERHLVDANLRTRRFVPPLIRKWAISLPPDVISNLAFGFYVDRSETGVAVN